MYMATSDRQNSFYCVGSRRGHTVAGRPPGSDYKSSMIFRSTSLLTHGNNVETIDQIVGIHLIINLTDDISLYLRNALLVNDDDEDTKSLDETSCHDC